MSNTSSHEVIIIGSGPAGLTAAIYAARADLSPLVIEGPQPGGQPVTTSLIENWPGEESIQGTKLISKIKKHAKHCGAQFLSGKIVDVDFKKNPFRLTTERNEILLAKTVIVATGAIPIKLKCPGEKKYWGHGISTCATCDGAFYKDKTVIVVGGGDSALTNVIALERFATKIYIIQLEEKLTAKPVLKKQILGNPKIKIICNSTIKEIKGNGTKITHVVVTNKKTNEKSIIQTDGIFLSIGLKPNTAIFKNNLEIDKYGYIKVKNHTNASIPGIFVAGDAADYKYRQAITAAGTGCMAALDAQHYLENIHNK